MLQQMSSLAGHAEARAALDARLCGDVSSEASSDAAEDVELPQCKIRRNYSCSKCTFFTQNPRVYLVHIRDVHFEKFKIYDCPQCLYASRHHQKLTRHVKMVHAQPSSVVPPKPDVAPSVTMTEPTTVTERIEDLLEEIEDLTDTQDMDDGSYQDESLEQYIEMDGGMSTPEHMVSSDSKKSRRSKFYTCSKCNYVTHLRSRYTKHVKYHSMPMIKCDLCDFRTPYKWNLDRHMKNHGGGGGFPCSVCNFTADIKQSLTVHEMNHHGSADGHSPASRRRNRVGASDVQHHLPDEEGSEDSRSSHSVPEYLDMSEGLNYNNDSNDMMAIESLKDHDSQGLDEHHSSNSEDMKIPSRKKARPLPQLIPLNASTPNQQKNIECEPPQKKMKYTGNDLDVKKHFDNIPPDISLIPVNNVVSGKSDNHSKKKNESFFDKLKERLLIETGKEGSLICKDCGFESKCLSEHSVHEKNCFHANKITPNASHSTLGSTRCQHCRHRCKSSADLYIHLQSCAMNNTKDVHHADERKKRNNEAGILDKTDDDPHPMENRVFVWNDINRNSNKFETILDISIQDDSTLPTETQKSYDPNNVDALHDNEGMNLSPIQGIGKRVYKCPHCPFWASTASRFHVHIVGHLNKKPFECSLCQYKSNWRWDITKHIKLKSARDPDHNDAKVLMTDETGRRNYSKYNKYLALLTLTESGENNFQYIDQTTISDDAPFELDESVNDIDYSENPSSNNMQPLNLETRQQNEHNTNDNSSEEAKKPKKTLWKCKKCNYKDPSKDALLEHVREHAKILDEGDDELGQAAKKTEAAKDASDLAYRCGHCNQLSNWKHVIQRHCRLKHEGVIKVITTEKPKYDQINVSLVTDGHNDFCNKCPFKTNDKKELLVHMQNHTPSPQSIFKCFFCYYFVKTEYELIQHLILHGINDPEEYISKAMGGKDPLPEPVPLTKRHKCNECPYETNSKSQYMYHEQFHRLPADTPYKCQECNYSVSKRHLLNQHMRVHGIFIQKKDQEYENDYASLPAMKSEASLEPFLEEIPYVWVSAKNEFHKMYKCRYCSYVNAQKCKIPNHEKIHCITFENSDITIYKCLECKFTCDNQSRLAEHSKSHSEIYGRIYFEVEIDVPDEVQIERLREVIEEEKQTALNNLNNKDETRKGGDEDKHLYFCQKCPARFLGETDLSIHNQFHSSISTYKCKSCEFSTPQENMCVSHSFVHTDEYQSKTKMLKIIHNTHPNYKEPILELIHCIKTSEMTWTVSNRLKKMPNAKKNNESKPKQYMCKLCPAKFFKNSALSYHVALHGAEGDFKCKKCDYTVKNIGNLAKHELVHEDIFKSNNCEYESGDDIDFKNIPLSGTDLFLRKTEAQKRVLTDKDKLVKPNHHFPPVLQADPQFGYLMHGNPEFIYPTYMKNGRQKEKRYKCHKCPSAFEKREQYKIHLSLHGSKQRYKCELCDYSVKYYANYVQHMRKHQMNDEAQADRKKDTEDIGAENLMMNRVDSGDNVKLAMKTIPRSDFQQFSVRDQQTLRLLQRRRSISSATKDGVTSESPATKERKHHLCLLCPYSNQRQDALSNHFKRHDNTDIHNLGSHKCAYCDLTVVQSRVLEDHNKLHFIYQKSSQPHCYAANEDVTFTLTKLDENLTTDFILQEDKDSYKSTSREVYIELTTM